MLLKYIGSKKFYIATFLINDHLLFVWCTEECTVIQDPLYLYQLRLKLYERYCIIWERVSKVVKRHEGRVMVFWPTSTVAFPGLRLLILFYFIAYTDLQNQKTCFLFHFKTIFLSASVIPLSASLLHALVRAQSMSTHPFFSHDAASSRCTGLCRWQQLQSLGAGFWLSDQIAHRFPLQYCIVLVKK